jgi:hypothetical protein
MRISLRDHHGKELDFANVGDARDAPSEAMLLLAKLDCLYPGSLLSFDNDAPKQEPGTLVTITVGNLQSLAGRLEQRAGVIALAQPLSAEDLRMAARFCRHALKVRWVGKTGITIA